MQVEVPTPEWTLAVPFWERWPTPGPESLIIDVPMVLGRPRPLNGVYVGGWGTHDLVCRGASPAGVWNELAHRFGPPIMPSEEFGWPSEASLQRVSIAMRRATAQLRDITIDLLARHPWQFACVVFGALHRAGHYLWDRSQIEPGTPPASPADLPSPALQDLYEYVDDAVGRVLDRVPAGTLVIVFAVHGMGPNPGWSDLLPDILGRIEAHRSGRPPTRGWLYRVRQAVPHRWQGHLLRLLPVDARGALVRLWSRRMYDWTSTRHFPVPMDEAGYLRVNLQGREREGIVTPEHEYDEVCAGLEALLAGLRDASSSQTIAGPVFRAYQEAGPEGRSRDLLPDLIVPFGGPSAAVTRHLVSSTLPGFRYEVPSRLPSGRSGNHRDHGWLMATGPGVPAGVTLDDHDVLDLLPTIRQSLGLPLDPELPGRPITKIAGT